jgi:hypothetical protein
MMQGTQMPQMPQMPMGVSSGFNRYHQIRQANEMQNLQKQASLMSLAMQMEKMKEYGANAGWRDAERQAGIARAGADTATIGRIKENAASEGELKNLRTRGTMDTDIEATNATNRAKVTDAQAQQMELFADMLDSSFDADNPGAVAQYSEILNQMKVPPNSPLRRLEQAQTPEQFKQGYKAMRTSLENNLKQRRALSKVGLEKGADYDRTMSVGRQEGEYSLERARIAAQGARDAAQTRSNLQMSMDKRASDEFAKYAAAVDAGDEALAKKHWDRFQAINRALFEQRPQTGYWNPQGGTLERGQTPYNQQQPPGAGATPIPGAPTAFDPSKVTRIR